MITPISGIGVVVPAKDEDQLLDAALTALTSARSTVRAHEPRDEPWIRIILVLDDCTDESAAIAAQWDEIEVLTVNYGAVGAARRHGIRHLLSTTRTAESEFWIANTDADSQVPANWLSEQWRLAQSGAEVMIGTVRPDFNDLSETKRDRWLATHTPGEANGHVHGANLGFRADRYREAGGFDPITEHEDVRLVEALTALGARSVATDECCVLTSGREYGRTPGGYASHLRERL
ncbi:glycosyltransferase [Salinibacterium sp. PAMC 21357]|uniref:glycosyltransferase n=1 Tax=Salinibacterium sp. PAMC 21357 TaxID=1112215 RepID=UPI000287BDD4|nr:glycosyltransferase [Salinibacterium sp. PAMC 21357]